MDVEGTYYTKNSAAHDCNANSLCIGFMEDIDSTTGLSIFRFYNSTTDNLNNIIRAGSDDNTTSVYIKRL